MRIPLTKYGLPQVVVYPVIVLALIAIAIFFIVFKPLLIAALLVLFAILIWMLAFFRDPHRTIKTDENTLYSPADGTITDIEVCEENDLGLKALRIGMFLSIFNVHINRCPCSVRVKNVVYKKGKFKNAMSSESGRVNESNSVFMIRQNEPRETILVKQISGAIARRIVCAAKENAEFRQGDQFGMIKFGSRTELYIPAGSHFEVKVKIGDKVRAGLTPLLSFTGKV